MKNKVVMKKKGKKGNKGFSLVELIVVICVMAVLTGIIAAAFIKYVGQSKDTADKSNLDEVRKTALTVLADPTLSISNESGEFVISADGTMVSNTIDSDGTKDGSFQKLLEAALGTNSNGKAKYPTLNDTTKQITIKLTGSATEGYSAEVTLTTKSSAE